ncbi:MAG: hypothetical protein OXE56_09285 [Gammaproteobacteria bacterium]|nr:hypothetical protein [Gammaproteobacteria bacterium]
MLNFNDYYEFEHYHRFGLWAAPVAANRTTKVLVNGQYIHYPGFTALQGRDMINSAGLREDVAGGLPDNYNDFML